MKSGGVNPGVPNTPPSPGGGGGSRVSAASTFATLSPERMRWAFTRRRTKATIRSLSAWRISQSAASGTWSIFSKAAGLASSSPQFLPMYFSRTGRCPGTAKGRGDGLRAKLGGPRRRQIPAAFRAVTGEDPLARDRAPAMAGTGG